MNDLISRLVALEAIRRLRGEIHTYPSDGCQKILIDKAEAQTELMLLPTACVSAQEWINFAKFVAKEVIQEDFGDSAFAEVACRKLNNLGIIEKRGDTWHYEEEEE